MKLIALNFKYFTIPWNVFDSIIVIASIFGMSIFNTFVLNILFLNLIHNMKVERKVYYFMNFRRFELLSVHYQESLNKI